MADEMLVMNDGEVVEAGDAEAIYAAPSHPYTRKLLAAIPRGYAARAPAQ
jgi:peptide/nickel transport system ATP-binding protein